MNTVYLVIFLHICFSVVSSDAGNSERLYLSGQWEKDETCEKVEEDEVCSGSCTFTTKKLKCNIGSINECDCSCASQIGGGASTIFPECSSKADFSRGKKKICNPLSVNDYKPSCSKKRCADRCLLSTNCVSYQFSKNSKTCLLYNGIEEPDKSYKGTDCYKFKNSSFKKYKNRICDPDAVIGFFANIEKKECKRNCVASSSCKAFQIGGGGCLLFDKRNAIKEEREFDGLSCDKKVLPVMYHVTPWSTKSWSTNEKYEDVNTLVNEIVRIDLMTPGHNLVEYHDEDTYNKIDDTNLPLNLENITELVVKRNILPYYDISLDKKGVRYFGCTYNRHDRHHGMRFKIITTDGER